MMHEILGQNLNNGIEGMLFKFQGVAKLVRWGYHHKQDTGRVPKEKEKMKKIG